MSDIILVTGGAGFIGSNFVRYVLKNSDATIINFDALTYAGNLENLRDVENNERYNFIHGDICNQDEIRATCKKYHVNAIINFAAESHVDRSILSAKPFVDTNVLGTLALLEVARELNIQRYLQVSTDEVYGSLGDEGAFTEETPLAPNSPYSASKASADMLVRAFIHTYNFPALITRCSNNYGPYQFPEKLIPLMILNALEGKNLPVYGDGMNVRDWLHVDDHCSAIWTVFKNGMTGEVYNIGGNSERTNIDVVRGLLKALGKSEDLITYVKDRPGHDRRYAIDASKIKLELGWEPSVTFEEGLKNTIQWYLDNQAWCDHVRSGEYKQYYRRQYEETSPQ